LAQIGAFHNLSQLELSEFFYLIARNDRHLLGAVGTGLTEQVSG